MNGQNIRPVHPFTMVPSHSLTPDCQVQPIGISNQELESLLAKPAKELPVQVSGATEMSRSWKDVCYVWWIQGQWTFFSFCLLFICLFICLSIIVLIKSLHLKKMQGKENSSGQVKGQCHYKVKTGIDLVQYYNGMNWKGNPYMNLSNYWNACPLDQQIDQIIVSGCQIECINNWIYIS